VSSNDSIMADEKTSRISGKTLGWAIVRALALVGILIVALLVLRNTSLARFSDREYLGAALENLGDTAWAAPLLIALYVILAPLGIPISPLVFVGGAVFGLAKGWLLNLLGSILGGTVTFFIGHAMGRDLVIHLVSERNLQRAEKLLEQHGFWAILRVRFLPIPFALVNYGCALVGVRPATFLTATSLGLAPSLLVYTALSYALVGVETENRAGVAVMAALALGGLLILTFLPSLLLRARAERRKRT
jgi:uncharacterized membrane protein YdjX (TVP38/TMEM64 family)